jgi:hypothetical protein
MSLDFCQPEKPPIRFSPKECGVLAVVCLVIGISIGRTIESRHDPDAEARQALQKQEQVLRAAVAALNAYANMLTNQPPVLTPWRTGVTVERPQKGQ